MEEILIKKYKGTEDDFYRIYEIGLTAEHDFHGPLFAVNTMMTAAREAANRAKFTAVKLMPDEHTREANDKEFHDARGVEMANVHGVFKTGMGFMDFKWKGDKVLLGTKKNQAGYAHFDGSTHNYGDALELITSLISFIGTNGSAMVDGGMPDGFPGSCASAKTDLEHSELLYTGQLEVSRSLTNAKMVKKNELYDDYQLTHTAAESAVFVSATTLALFTYGIQYEIIHPPHQMKQEVGVKEAGHKDIHNAVKLKDIKNLGAEVVYMYDLDKPINEGNKITFNPGDVKQNTYSENLRFVNLSTHNKGNMEVWRVVHKD